MNYVWFVPIALLLAILVVLIVAATRGSSAEGTTITTILNTETIHCDNGV